ncbi:MAG: HdeD family acid-resistance protein [Solirubrobacterales bacterium]
MADAVAVSVVTVKPPRWWVVVVLGLISIAAGILAVAYADITLRVLGIVIGVYLLVAGAVWVTLAVEEEASPGLHVLRMIVGFLALLAGLVCIVRPGASVLAVLLAVAFWFLMVGVADLARAIVEPRARWVSAIFGVAALAVGIILIADPDIGVNTIGLIVGIGFMVRGVLEVLGGVLLRTQS